MSTDSSKPPSGDTPPPSETTAASGPAEGAAEGGGGGFLMTQALCVFLGILIIAQVAWLVRSSRNDASPSAPGQPPSTVGQPMGMGGSPGPGTPPMGMGGSPAPGMPAMGVPPMGMGGSPAPGMPPLGAPPLGMGGSPMPGMPQMGVPPMGMGGSPVPGMAPMMGASPFPGMPPGPGAGGPGPGGPPGGAALAPVDEMPKLVNKIISLNSSKTPLTTAQRAKLLPIAKKMVETSSEIQAELQKIVGALRPAQVTALMTPHPEIMNAMGKPPDGMTPGEDPLTSRTLAALRKAASGEKPASASSSSSTSASAPQPAAPMFTLDRMVIGMGILYLQTQPDLALTPDQAKAALESFERCGKKLGVLSQSMGEIAAILTSEQTAAVNAQTVACPEDTASRCLLYSLEAASK